MTPKVSIIILDWNSWKDMIECSEGVFRISYPNYKVAVIDNGSTNGSIEKIKEWAKSKQEVLTPEPPHPLYHLSHPPALKPIPYIEYNRQTTEKGGDSEIENKLMRERANEKMSKQEEENPLINKSIYLLILIQTGENLGFAGGNNIGIRYALKKGDCDYVWLLNNDTVVGKDALVEIVKVAESNESIGLCGSKLLKMYNLKIIDSAGYVFKWGRTIDRGEGEIDKGQYDDKTNVIGAMAATCLYRVKMLRNIGLFDESFFMQYEDADLSWRANLRGWEAKLVPQSVVCHKRGGGKSTYQTTGKLPYRSTGKSP